MRKDLLLCLIAACFVLLLSNFGIASPSFDCSKASTEVEKLICGNDVLSKLDNNLATAYADVFSKLDETEKVALKKTQIEWIRMRSNLISESLMQGLSSEGYKKDKVAKLKEAYEKRIIELSRIPKIQVNEKKEKEFATSGDDRWGVKLPLPDDVIDDDVNPLLLYMDKKSNIYFLYHYSFSNGETGARLFDFKKNRIIEDWGRWNSKSDHTSLDYIVENARRIEKKYTLINEYDSRKDSLYISLSNNLKLDIKQLKVNCDLPHNSYFEISDINNSIIAEKLLVVSSENKHKFISYDICHIRNGKSSPLMGGKSSIMTSTFSISPAIYIVDKNTIFIHGMGSPYIIKFNGDLESHYLKNNAEIMWVDKNRMSSAMVASEYKTKELFKNSTYDALIDGRCFMEHYDQDLTKCLKAETP